MTIQEFLMEKIESYLETRENTIQDTKKHLKRAKLFPNGNIVWSEQDDDMMHYNNLNNLQEDFDQDWSEWVTMSPEFSEFTEEEQDEIEEHDLFQQTPIKVWELIK